MQVCLAKDPSDRWHTAHDVLVQLRWIQQEGSRVGVLPVLGSRRKARTWWLAAVAVILAAAGAIGWRVFMTSGEPGGPLARLELPMPSQLSLPDFGSPVLSPDGQRLVIPAAVDGKLQLYLRRLDDSSFVPIPGTEDARGPFWSPDSRSIGFFASGKLRRIDVAGGTPTALCDAAGGGGSWNADGVIVFGPGQGQPLFRIADEGGTPVPVTVLNSARKETGHRSPYFLPDGRTFLFLTAGPEAAIFAGSLDSTDVAKQILPDNTPAVYARSGHILFLRQDALMALPFDVRRLEASGAPLPVATDVRGGVSAALNGTLVYRTRDPAEVQLTWFTRDGKRLAAVGSPGPYRQIALSPSGRRVAIQQGDARFLLEAGSDLWLMDLTTGVHSRLTSHPAFDADPSWSPDERSLAFTSTRIGRHALFKRI